MSIQAVKAVEIGSGVAAAAPTAARCRTKSPTTPRAAFARPTNRAGGLEGGITNGEDVVVRGYLKPISTLRRALGTADLATKQAVQAAYERSDVCVVPAGGVAGEAMTALVLAGAFLEKFGGDSLAETRRNFDGYQSNSMSSEQDPLRSRPRAARRNAPPARRSIRSRSMERPCWKPAPSP